jgi:hypothetical protein
MAGPKWANNIVTYAPGPKISPEFAAPFAKVGKLILWLDNKVVPGAFQMNCVWYFAPTQRSPGGGHKHDVPEIIGFFGSDYENPHDMGGELEFWMEDEKFLITESVMIFVPAGVQHCPIVLTRVDRPIFHFSAVTSGEYQAIVQSEREKDNE